MKIKQKIISVLIMTVFAVFMIAPTTSALVGDSCGNATLQEGQSCCGGVATSILACEEGNGNGVEGTTLWGLLLMIVNILSAGVGILGVGGLVYASIIYTTAGGNTDKVKQSTTMIFNVVVGLVAYAFMYSLLNFLIPGGLFN